MFGKKQPETLDTMALDLATQFQLDLQKVKDTFSGNESGLRDLFNTATQARHDRNKYGVGTLALGTLTAFVWPAALLTVPVGAYTGTKTYKSDQTLNWVGNQLRSEIAKKSAASAPAPAAPGT